MHYNIIDLHSDLLSYLVEQPGRTPHDPESRSSLSQLKKGKVQLQTLAIFSHTKEGSTQAAQSQLKKFQELTELFPLECAPYFSQAPLSPPTHFILAFENASGFAEEREPLSQSFQRLEMIHRHFKHLLYIGMTWDGENRFGGGVGSSSGLKEDGKRLLDWMDNKKIAIDFSHTSDALAEGILNYIDQINLKIPVLASHSNFRFITDLPRNMPNWLAKELISRQGLIGINLFAPFIRKETPHILIDHIEHALSLHAQETLAFGADFFCDTDFSTLTSKYQTHTAFFQEYNNSSCYGSILSLLSKQLGLSDALLHKIASNNAHAFLKRID